MIKTFITPHKDVIIIKIIEDNLYIYLNEDELIQIVHITHRDENIKILMECIQISRDFKYISLINDNQIKIYDLNKLIIDHALIHHVTLGNITEIIDNDIKCYMFDGIYIIQLLSKMNTIVMTYDHKSYTLKRPVKLSSNGKYGFINDKDNDNNYIKIYDIAKGTNQRIKLNPNHNVISLSNDGTMILTRDDKMIYLVDIYDHKIELFKINNNIIFDDLIKFDILHYNLSSDSNNIGVNNVNNVNKMWIVTLWNIFEKHIIYWIVIKDKEEYKILNTTKINMHLHDTIEYAYSNGDTFIYKTPSKIMVIRLAKILLVKLLEVSMKEHKNALNDFYQIFTESTSDYNYYNVISIKGSDDIIIDYNLSPFLVFMMEMHKINMMNKGIINKFEININSNLPIYRINDRYIKSFEIFCKLIQCEKDIHDEIINGIFEIDQNIARHHIMETLIEHLIEYSKLILRINGNEQAGYKVLYISYHMLILIIKYYDKLSGMINNHNNHHNYNNHNNYNLCDIFIEAFPIFTNFIDGIDGMIKN